MTCGIFRKQKFREDTDLLQGTLSVRNFRGGLRVVEALAHEAYRQLEGTCFLVTTQL